VMSLGISHSVAGPTRFDSTTTECQRLKDAAHRDISSLLLCVTIILCLLLVKFIISAFPFSTPNIIKWLSSI
jgi:hypothetical protein